MIGLVELVGALLDLLTIASWIADFIAWLGSRASRLARKDAKAQGEPLPSRSRSHVAFIVLTVASLILTLLLLLKWFGLLPRAGQW